MQRELSVGSSGEDVKNLQGMLNFHLKGTRTAALIRDGKFGPKTRAAVITFQTLNKLQSDGIVGLKTRTVLLDVKNLRTYVRLSPMPSSVGQFSARPNRSRSVLLVSDPAAPDPLPNVNARQIALQVGSQANINPWFISPFVITGQWNIQIQNQGRHPFVISPSLQFTQNLSGSPGGNWSGQAGVQMGPSDVLKVGQFSLVNPFVQAFVQKNEGQPFNVGFSVGDQINFNIIDDKLALSLNLQEVFSVDLSTGKAAAPATQILLGPTITFDVTQVFKR
jgi:hypothetical protein